VNSAHSGVPAKHSTPRLPRDSSTKAADYAWLGNCYAPVFMFIQQRALRPSLALGPYLVQTCLFVTSAIGCGSETGSPTSATSASSALLSAQPGPTLSSPGSIASASTPSNSAASSSSSSAANVPGLSVGVTPISDVLGMYSIEMHTRNSSACTAGASVLDSDPLKQWVAGSNNQLGQQTLVLAPCESESCSVTARKIANRGSYSTIFTFTESVILGTFEGQVAISGATVMPGICSGRSYRKGVAQIVGKKLHVEITNTALPDAPAEDGFCFADVLTQKTEAASLPCISLETWDATWQAATE
jgi:hypothetical protein